MTFYTRKQVMELLEIEDGFLISLEREEIVVRDAPSESAGEYSEQMLERARVAQNLVRDLDVNLPGVAVIVRLREEVAGLRRGLEQLMAETGRIPPGSTRR
ncbi:MAG TPA: chaperone modulator CbpM [Myxococcota bacterium]|nr:chaperone modulator CbpM [Myxococcota bacterium]